MFITTHPSDPIHSDNCQQEDTDKCDAPNQPDVVAVSPVGTDDSSEIGNVLEQHVQKRVAETNRIHGNWKVEKFVVKEVA